MQLKKQKNNWRPAVAITLLKEPGLDLVYKNFRPVIHFNLDLYDQDGRIPNKFLLDFC